MQTTVQKATKPGVVGFYENKCILLTGTTGFIGKVILERYLRDFSNLKRIYVMIRKKKGLNPMERFKKEILGSECFAAVKKMQGAGFNDYINRIIRPVSGDLLADNLGLSKEDYKELTENLNVIVSCAASVDFNSRLDEAISINVHGALKMMELAKASKNIENFVHVSTCYVNSDKKGQIEEKIYDIDRDPEEIIAELLRKPVDDLVKETPKILGNFPNTYTFTKSMAERIIRKRKGNLTVTLVRPSIVGSAWREPTIGWIDSISASASVYLLSGLGVMHVIQGDEMKICDQVPVDYVSDVCIVTGAVYANDPKDVHVINCGSSGKHPVNWRLSFDQTIGYFRNHPPSKKVGKSYLHIIKNKKYFETVNSAYGIFPKVYQKAAQLSRNSSMKKNADRLVKIVDRTKVISELFEHFSMNQWIFQSEKLDQVIQQLSPEERKKFFIDITEVDWRKYFTYFAWGLHKYVLKESPDYPTNEPTNMNILEKSGEYFEDFKWALNKGLNFQPRSKTQMKSVILNSPRLQALLADMTEKRKSKNVSAEVFRNQLNSQANKFCEQLFSTYNMKMVRLTAFVINKIVRQMYEKVVFDENQLAKISNIDFKTQGPTVIVPTHRSFVDFVLLSYIMFAYKLKAPHIAASEEFLHIAVVHILFRASGGFFMKRTKVDNMELYDAILYEYIQRLLLEESQLEFFLEGTRSRYGKTLSPKVDVLEVVTDTFLDRKVPDTQIIPVTINYERVVEGDTFPFELLGDEKLRLSLIKFLGAYKIFSTSFGKVVINFCDPISLKDYLNKKSVETEYQQFLPKGISNSTQSVVEVLSDNKQYRKKATKDLAFDILKICNQNAVIMPTSIVASILLMHRKGINEETLFKKVDWLVKLIKERGGKLSTDIPSIAVKNGLHHLQHLIDKKKDIFHPSFSAKKEYKNIILMSYYRNMLGHVFFNEAIVACALTAYGYELAWKEGVSLSRLWDSTTFLQSIIGNEFLVQCKINQTVFDKMIDQFLKNDILKLDSTKVRITTNGEQLINFLCFLVWPLIEGYWVSAVYLYTLKNREALIPLERFEVEVQGFAESMHEERTMEFYEACAIDTIRNALHCYRELNLIKVETKQDEQTKEYVEYVQLNAKDNQLRDIISNIQGYMKTSLASTIDFPIHMSKKSMLVDFPFMSKL